MNRDEFLKSLHLDQMAAFDFLKQSLDTEASCPSWLTLDRDGDPILSVGTQFRVDPGRWPAEFSPPADARISSVEVPLRWIYGAHLARHKREGILHVVHKDSDMFTVACGHDIELLFGLGIEYEIRNETILRETRREVSVDCALYNGRLVVHYLGAPLGSDEMTWSVLASSSYSDKTACDWKLRHDELSDLDKARVSISHIPFLDRIGHGLLHRAARVFDCATAPACEILPIPADVTNSEYGFALCAEMTQPEAVNRFVIPHLRKQYSDDIIWELLESVGVRAGSKDFSGDAPEFPGHCFRCGSKLDAIDRIEGHQVLARCRRCWLETKADVVTL
jgi:hypothetical protein